MKRLNLFAVGSLETNASSERKRNFKKDGNETISETSGGRSMVEMLGVLAIIGVLSVGGLVGYNTAMYKYRMNKTIQTVSEVFRQLLELSGEKANVSIYSREDIIDYELLPEDMCPESRNTNWLMMCKLPLGEFSIDFTQQQSGAYQRGYLNIIFQEGDIVKSCVDFLSYGWQNIYPQEWLRSSFIALNARGWQNLWASEPAAYQGAKKDNVILSDVQRVCDNCRGLRYCRIKMSINGS